MKFKMLSDKDNTGYYVSFEDENYNSYLSIDYLGCVPHSFYTDQYCDNNEFIVVDII
jgi:hypothetical protein